MLVNARLRWPGLPFEVREVAVQGVHAVSQVTAAIRELDIALSWTGVSGTGPVLGAGDTLALTRRGR